MAVPAKRSANLLVPEDVLQSMAASLNAATLALMDLPCGDIAARGRAVAVMADCKRRMHDLLGIKRRVSEICGHNYLDCIEHLMRKCVVTQGILVQIPCTGVERYGRRGGGGV